MRTEHFLFDLIGITHISRVTFVQNRKFIKPPPPGCLATDRSKAVIWM